MCHELPRSATILIDILDHESKKKLIFKDTCIDCWECSTSQSCTCFSLSLRLCAGQEYFLLIETERFEWKELMPSAIPERAHNLDDYLYGSLIQAESPGNTAPDSMSLPDSNLVIETSEIRKPKQTSFGHRMDCFACREGSTAKEPSRTPEALFVPVYPNSHPINEDGIRDGNMTSAFPNGMENGLDGHKYLIRMNVLNVGSARDIAPGVEGTGLAANDDANLHGRAEDSPVFFVRGNSIYTYR
ncbi:hypothetical protein ACEPAI_8386 [Sanghuangporus weigelae]